MSNNSFISGSNYVQAPNNQYESVRGISVNNNEGVIPSGATLSKGWYFQWTSNGFTGNGWHLDIPNSPLNYYSNNHGGRFNSDEDVLDYLSNTEESGGNLDAIFIFWQNYINNVTDESNDAYTQFLDATVGCRIGSSS